MAIPGHQDTTLHKFEDSLYMELCRQHDRLDLFVASKAAEISRQLDHISKSIHRWISNSRDQLSAYTSFKCQRRLVKYERQLVRRGGDIQSLSRFANAQGIGFRKIIKKYKKWTGSTTLGSRFNENVLTDPKSFTRRDFTALHTKCNKISFTLHASAAAVSKPGSPGSIQLPFSDEGTRFLGLDYMQGALRLPIEKVREWLKLNKAAERRPLLPTNGLPIGNYSAAVSDDFDGERCVSPEGCLSSGYAAVLNLHHQVNRYLEIVLFCGTIGCFIASFILLAIAGILIITGKHKPSVEVNVGVTIGIVASLISVSTALGITLYRRDSPPLFDRLIV
ncbi:hypothetical protein FSOLCH5_011552 [Fusarium solani]